MDPLARVRSFLKAPIPNSDMSAVRGNLTLDQKQLVANFMADGVAAGTKVFANEQLSGLTLVEANVRPRREGIGGESGGTDGMEGEVICELQVKEGMLNIHGGMSGGCCAAAVDVVTFGALIALGAVLNIDPSGMSTAMNLTWYAPAWPGMTLSIVATSISMKGRMYTSRAEAYDKKSGKLLASVTQSIVPLSKLSPARQTGKTKL